MLDGQPGVRESRVVGRAHPRLGEVPCAEIVPEPGRRPTTRRSAAACAEVLSTYKVPVEFRDRGRDSADAAAARSGASERRARVARVTVGSG